MSDIHYFYPRETIEEEARVWLIKLDGDLPLSADEQKSLQEWCQRSPAHREELLRIAKFFEEANLLVNLAVPMKNHNRVWMQSPFAGLKLFRFPRVAAISFLGVLIIGLVVLFKVYPLDNITELNGLYATAVGEIREQKLVDGSIVYLNTNSRVDIDYNSAIRKIRLLKGEAHFSVAKDRDWPFEVYVGEKMVKAVGTAFTIKIAGQGMSVAVTEGKVDLINLVEPVSPIPAIKQSNSEKKINKIGSLERGQQAVLSMVVANDPPSAAAEVLAIDPISDQQIEKKMSWQTGYLMFAGDTLVDVVAEISRYTNTHIEIGSPELSDLRIGGRFKVDDLGALFNVLESNMGITVTQLDNDHILLNTAKD